MFMSTIGNNMPSLLKTIVIAEVNRGCPYHFKDWFLPPDTTHTLKTNVHMVFIKKNYVLDVLKRVTSVRQTIIKDSMLLEKKI